MTITSLIRPSTAAGTSAASVRASCACAFRVGMTTEIMARAFSAGPRVDTTVGGQTLRVHRPNTSAAMTPVGYRQVRSCRSEDGNRREARPPSPTHDLTTRGLNLLLRVLLQVGDQVAAVLLVLEAGEGHLGAG